MAAKTVNPRSITDAERPWLEAWSLPVQVQLIELVRSRSSNEMALSLAGWLTGKYAGHDLATDSPKARYRKVLRQLAAEGITPDPSSSSARRKRTAAAANGSRVATSATTLTAIVALAAVALSTGVDKPPGMYELCQVPEEGLGEEDSLAGRPALRLVVGANDAAAGHVPDTCPPAPPTRAGHVSLAA